MTRSRTSYVDQGRAAGRVVVPGALEGEEWRVVTSSPNYAVSSLGRVMRVHGGKGAKSGLVLKQTLHTTGYSKVSLCTDGVSRTRRVHQLVCEAFHGPKPTSKHQVAHRDGDRTNSRAENLRWATQVENEADKLDHGTRFIGEQSPVAKYDAATILAIRAAKGTHQAIGDRFGISRRYVGYIRAGQRWKYLEGGVHA